MNGIQNTTTPYGVATMVDTFNITLKNSTFVLHQDQQQDNITHLPACGQPIPPLEVFLVIIFVLILIGGIITNGSVCFVTYLCRHLRRPDDIFIVNLALGDMGVSLFTSIYHIISYSGVCVSKFTCVVTMVTEVTSSVASVMTLIFIGLDRYFALEYPYRYRALATRRRAVLACMGIWLYSSLFGILVPFDFHNLSNISIVVQQNICINTNSVYIFTLSLLNIHIPLFLLLFAYGRVAYIANQQKKQIIRTSIQSSTLVKNLREIRSTKRVVIVYVTFAVCWLPMGIISVVGTIDLRPFKYLSEHYPAVMKCMEIVCLSLMPPLNSVINPILYCISGKRLREAIDNYIQKCESALLDDPPPTLLRFLKIFETSTNGFEGIALRPLKSEREIKKHFRDQTCKFCVE